MEEKIKILIVDDDSADRLAVIRAVRMSGYNVEVKECPTAECALKELKGGSFDLAFFDMNLPGISGMELLIECQQKNIRVPVVMMTGQGDESLAVECMKKGAFDYLPKPLINAQQAGKIFKNFQRIRHAEKNTEAAIQEVEQTQSLVRQIISGLPIVIFSIDKEGIFKVIDGKPSELLCFKAEEINNRPVFELEEMLPIHVSDYLKAMEGETTESSAEINGRTLLFRYFPHVLKNRNEKIVCGIITDITSEKQKQEELQMQIKQEQELQKIKESFMANMSHEIRTPIHGIINLAGILLGTPLNNDQKRFIEAIKKSADNLHVIINDILDLSKIQANKMTFESYPFSIREAVGAIVELFRPSAENKNLKFECIIEESVPELINGDMVRFSQIINNLTGNAIKFTESGSVQLYVRCLDRNEQYAVIETEVRDSGIGIPADKINRIFDAFIQAGDDTTRKYGGTGLGLSICKSLVEMQGGNIRVESTPHKGSRFIFSIPFEINNQPQTVHSPVHRAEEEINHIPLHLLVVEDNDINRMIITKLLNDWNFTYDCAHDGLTAIELIERNNYDVVLLDVEMPGMKGYEVSKYIRKELRKAELPVVAMTAHANKEEEQKCLDSGMNDYISKPFNPEDLKLIIYSVIGKQQAKAVHDTPSAPVANQAGRITDLTYLHELSEGNEEFFKEFITLFLQNAPVSISEIFAGIESADWEKVRQSAHKLKPSMSYVGMKEIHALVAQMEEYAKKKTNLDEIPAMAEKVKQACEKAFTELEKEIQITDTK